MALIAITAFIGLGVAIMPGSASWLSSAIVFAALLYAPLAQGPFYSLTIPEAPTEGALSDGVSRYVRLVVVGVLTDIFLAIPGLLLSVIGLGVAYGMAYAYPGFNPMDAKTWTAGGPVLSGGGAVLALGGLGILWLSARVALGPAQTVAQRRVLMISTWPLTRGFGWRIVIARSVVTLSVFAIVWAVTLALRSVAPAGWPMRAIPVVGGLILLTLRLPMIVGVLSYFHAHRAPLPVAP